MASTSYERQATELAWEVTELLNERDGHGYVVEGSTLWRKCLRIVDPDNGWKTVTEFRGSKWEDVYRAMASMKTMLEYIKED